MKKIYFIFFLSTIVCITGYSKSLPSKCEAFSPRVLNKLTIYLSEVERLPKTNYGQKEPSTNKYWDVYSDRCDNVAYKGPNTSSGTTGKKLAFNQKVRIAKVENGFAWVYIENKPGSVNYPQLSTDCNPVGWIPMDNLLLWASCPVNDVGINHKVFIVRNFDQKHDQNFEYLFQHPNLSTPANANLKSSFGFLHYIMKEVNGRCLLANSNNLCNTMDQVLEGWVSNKDIIPGIYRIFLEPNWNPEDAEKLKESFAYVYHNDKIVAAIPMGLINTNNRDSLTKYRIEPDVMRFPLLEDKSDKNNQYQVLAFISTGMADIPHTKVRSFFTNDSEIEFPREEILTAVHGYVDKKDSKTGLDYWNVVLLLSSEELIELIKKFEPLKAAIKINSFGSQERVNYIKGVTALVQSMTGRSTEYLEQLSTEEISKIIAGLNVSTPMIKGEFGKKIYTLSDIKNVRRCSEEEFKTILIEMESKIDKLSSIPYSSSFKFSFICNGVRYYWIPLEIIP